MDRQQNKELVCTKEKDLQALATSYANLWERIQELETILKGIRTALLKEAGEVDSLDLNVDQNRVVMIRRVQQFRFNTLAFKKDSPEMYVKYLEPKEYCQISVRTVQDNNNPFEEESDETE